MFKKAVDDVGPLVVPIDTVEDVAGRLHRQCGDLQTFAVRGGRRDTGSDTDAYCFELAQFIHRRIDFLGICSLGVKNGFGVV